VSILKKGFGVEGSSFEEVAAELVEVVAEDCADRDFVVQSSGSFIAVRSRTEST
jgi:hypothetical protein